MTDETTPPDPAPLEPVDTPPLPQPYMLPTQLIEKWLQIPANQYVEARLTRNDLDSLFFGLTRQSRSIQHLEQALVRWANKDVDEANKALNESRRLTIEADNFIRQFFAAIMISVTTK